jgi:kinetochore protein Mis13/DSN1
VGAKDSKGKGKNEEGKSLPPLSEDQKALLRSVQEDAVRMLAERKIALDVISHSHSHPSTSDSSVDSNVLGGLSSGSGVNGSGGKDKEMKMKPNEQNERNRAREVTFSGFIEK